jgi:hypothetical protein
VEWLKGPELKSQYHKQKKKEKKRKKEKERGMCKRDEIQNYQSPNCSKIKTVFMVVSNLPMSLFLYVIYAN